MNKFIKKLINCLALAVFAATVLPLRAEVPPAEKLLPPDTLVVVTAPDFAALKDASNRSPQTRLWQDPAMKPFVDKFTAKLTEEITAPLEKDLGVTLSNYVSLLQGQLTFAFVQNGWSGGDEKPQPAWLLLLDSKDQSGQLSTNLTQLKRKWTDADKNCRAETIRGVEFTVVKLTTNDVPDSMKKLLPSEGPTFPDADPESPATPKNEPVSAELFIGQSGSLFLAGNEGRVIEKVLAAQAGSSAPTLSENPTFEANRLMLFRDALFFGWVNTKAITDMINNQLASKDDSAADEPSFLPFKPEAVIGALGLDKIKSAAFSIRNSSEGSTAEIFLTAPAADRRGLLNLIAAEPKETLPPTFVPANVVKYQRFRMNGQKTWANLERTVNDLSPQLLGGLNFAIELAGSQIKEKNPDYDLKKSLLDSLGDDFISYEESPRGSEISDLATPPSLLLIGASKPDKLLEAIKYLVAGTYGRGESPKEREFRGRKIYSIALPSPRMTTESKQAGEERAINFAEANGYVAFSTDNAILEEFLRSSETSAKPLREVAGLNDAAQKVSVGRTSWFTYENQAEGMRTTINAIKQTFAKDTKQQDAMAMFGLPNWQKFFKEWFDVSLLPEFDRIAKYFHYSVSAGNSTDEGLDLKIFTPVPPQLRASADTNP